MPSELAVEVFTADNAHKVAGFSCGSESWETRLNEWITGSDVLRSMQRGTQVLLYFLGGRLVGFGSVGTTEVSDPWPKGKKTPAAIIPAVAIDSRFQGQPANVGYAEKFSGQIMGDLIARAMQFGVELLVLHVHKNNQIAQRLYQRWGFEVQGDSHKEGHYLMALKLR